MTLITLETAKLHLSVDGTDDDALITLYIGAAERSIVEYVCRNIYADQTALDAALAAAPAALVAATTAYDAAILAADAMDDGVPKDMAVFAANEAYLNAQQTARMTYQGIVVNDQIKAALLLIVGKLYACREDAVVGVSVTQLPNGAEYLLQPYRTGIGV